MTDLLDRRTREFYSYKPPVIARYERMMRGPTDEELKTRADTQLRQWVAYDPNTGALTWRHSPGNYVPAGSPAGTRHHRGYIEIEFNGVRTPAHEIAWFLAHGRWPERRLKHIDGDRANNRLANLREPPESRSQRARRLKAEKLEAERIAA